MSSEKTEALSCTLAVQHIYCNQHEMYSYSGSVLYTFTLRGYVMVLHSGITPSMNELSWAAITWCAAALGCSWHQPSRGMSTALIWRK